MFKQDSKMLFQQYYDIKRMFELPLKVKLYFSTLEGIIDKTHHLDVSKQQVVDFSLIKSFHQQSDMEKITYLLQMMKGLQNYFQKSDGFKQKEKPSLQTNLNNIETSCHIQSFTFKISHWVYCKFKYDKLKQNLNICHKKKNFTVSLQNYFVRRSKHKQNTIVLESLSKEISTQYIKISLKFKPQVFAVVYKELFQCACEILKEKVIDLTKACIEESEPNKQSKENGIEPISFIDKSFTFLSSEQITNYLNYKKKILNRLMVGGFQFKNIYSKEINSEEVKIERSTKIEKIFKLELIAKKSREQLKDEFLESVDHKYRYKIESTVLEEFSKKYKAVYQKYLISNKVYQQISINEQNHSDKEEIYFSKGIDNIMTNNYLEFLIAKVRSTEKEGYNRLIIVASLILSKDITLQIAIAFLLEFKDMLGRCEADEQTSVQDNEQDEFYTIQEQSQDEQSQFEEQPSIIVRHQQLAQILIKEATIIDINCLVHRFILSPIEYAPHQLAQRIIKQHYFSGVWGRSKKGGVVCINQKINSELRSIVFRVIKHLGTNVRKIVASGNFLNHALPICVFTKASHLQLIANNFAYAPLFFDRFQTSSHPDPLERLKFVHLFNLSASNLAISHSGPFNPVLGQTWQGWLAGCPIYLQQISHHPPMSYFLFMGRGYKIYGVFEGKVQVGFNNISCHNSSNTVIEFEDGSKVYFLFARMCTSGLIFGDREFNYIDKAYAFDTKNHLFSTMHFGPNKANKGRPIDFVHGNISQLIPAYNQKFFQKSPIIYPDKSYIEKELCTFEGIWNEAIRFDGKEYYDFTKDLPYQMEYQQHPIPSNSTFRKDICFYRENDEEKAAENKIILQELQRRDRKLREKHKNKKKKVSQ